MSAKPWPHGWLSGMRRLRPKTGQSWRASRAWDQDEGGESLRWKQEPGGRLSDSEAPWPRDVPDLDDGPTKGALLEMVREAMRASKRYDLAADIYVLECDEEFGTEDDGPVCGWFDGITGKSYETDGTAYVAALDRLAERVKQ